MGGVSLGWSQLKKKEKMYIHFLDYLIQQDNEYNYFGPNLFRPKALPGPNFFKLSIPGDLRVFRAFASLFLLIEAIIHHEKGSKIYQNYFQKIVNQAPKIRYIIFDKQGPLSKAVF